MPSWRPSVCRCEAYGDGVNEPRTVVLCPECRELERLDLESENVCPCGVAMLQIADGELFCPSCAMDDAELLREAS